MITDCHNHCTADGSRWIAADDLVRSMDRHGIDRACCSCPITTAEAPPDEVRHCNDLILDSMKAWPDRILGFAFVNPGYARETQDEITRSIVDGGMSGVKLYHQYTISDPVQFPLIERCIDLGVPVLMHAAYPSAPELLARQPNVSTGDHFAEIAQRYPEALLICGHIGGGGDWERQLKGLRTAPSVYLDTSGSVIDNGMIERCVRDLGAERLLFATDGSMERGLGKIRDAGISEDDRHKIMSVNFDRLLRERKI